MDRSDKLPDWRNIVLLMRPKCFGPARVNLLSYYGTRLTYSLKKPLLLRNYVNICFELNLAAISSPRTNYAHVRSPIRAPTHIFEHCFSVDCDNSDVRDSLHLFPRPHIRTIFGIEW